MHTSTDPIAEVREQVAARLRELETALVAHGFTVGVETKFWRLDVHARADRLALARTQRVQLAPGPAGTLTLYWHLVLPGEVEGVLRNERIAPEEDIRGAAERIAQALTRGGAA